MILYRYLCTYKTRTRVLSMSIPTGSPTCEEIALAYERVAQHRTFTSGDETVVSTLPNVAIKPLGLNGISLVSRLLEELDASVQASPSTLVLEYPKDIPIFTFSHESRILTECYPFPLPDGTLATMMPCTRGCACMGMSRQIEGHETSGGVIVRALLTPEELVAFEYTGKNPPGPRLCILCARIYVSEAYFETQDARYETVLRDTCFNFYGNLRGCREGYKIEHSIPLGSGTRWSGLVAPVACNALSKMRIKKVAGVWTVDQRELAYIDPSDRSDANSEKVRYFR